MGTAISLNLRWKVVSVVFMILTIGASTLAYYYYQQTQTKISDASTLNTQIQQLQNWVNGNKTLAADYRAKANDLQTRVDTLGTANASETAQIQTLNAKVTDLQSNVVSLQAQIADWQAKYSTLLAQNATLTIENQALAAENNALVGVVHQLFLQVGNLTLIVNLQVSKVLAHKITLPWSSGDTIPIPEATVAYNYSGYVTISWSSTQSITFKLAYSVAGNSTSITSNSSGKDTFSVPIIASPFFPTPATASFHNDGCSIFGCPSGTVTYTVTYWY